MSQYTPSDDVKAALQAVKDAEDALKLRRKELRAAVAADLKANPDVTNDVMAEHLPFTSETVRQIAREYDVPRKRNPTVRSIKGAKRAAK
jgi:hypothetical protein